MSAGGLSYSGLVNHGKVSLPSVESWGENMNILRDPPKSITTRRIEKVGQTSSVTQMIDESDGRVSEAIQLYARGVNPSVSVSYNNYGNNGGQRYGGITEGGQQVAKLPYRIMRDGSFRPPVLLQEDLLPLSRIPRSRTSASSNAGFTDFSRKMRSCGTAENTREVKTNTLKTFVRPTAVYKIESQAQKPFEVKYVIQPSIKNSASSGMRTMDITQKYTGKPTKEIINDLLHAKAQSNVSDVRHIDNNEFYSERYLQNSLVHPVTSNISSIMHNTDNNELETGRFLQNNLLPSAGSNISSVGYLAENELNTGKFIQETLPHHVISNASSKAHHTFIDDIIDLSDMPVRNQIMHYRIDAPISGVEQTKYFHDDLALSRTLPNFKATTNIGDVNVYKRTEYDNQIELQRNNPATSCESNPNSYGNSDISSREARLAPKISAGGYSIPVQIPMKEREHIYFTQESEKAKMNRFVLENMNGRYDKANPFMN
uniref:Uncharacterized protein n=1 Tax=viral metagenome TaxID=1070528 RepID=A0A6C0H4V7_9ZZZZ